MRKRTRGSQERIEFKGPPEKSSSRNSSEILTCKIMAVHKDYTLSEEARAELLGDFSLPEGVTTFLDELKASTIQWVMMLSMLERTEAALNKGKSSDSL